MEISYEIPTTISQFTSWFLLFFRDHADKTIIVYEKESQVSHINLRVPNVSQAHDDEAYITIQSDCSIVGPDGIQRPYCLTQPVLTINLVQSNPDVMQLKGFFPYQALDDFYMAIARGVNARWNVEEKRKPAVHHHTEPEPEQPIRIDIIVKTKISNFRDAVLLFLNVNEKFFKFYQESSSRALMEFVTINETMSPGKIHPNSFLASSWEDQDGTVHYFHMIEGGIKFDLIQLDEERLEVTGVCLSHFDEPNFRKIIEQISRRWKFETFFSEVPLYSGPADLKREAGKPDKNSPNIIQSRDDAILAKIQAFRGKGWSYRAMEGNLGLSRTTLYRLRREAGLVKQRKRKADKGSNNMKQD